MRCIDTDHPVHTLHDAAKYPRYTWDSAVKWEDGAANLTENKNRFEARKKSSTGVASGLAQKKTPSPARGFEKSEGNMAETFSLFHGSPSPPLSSETLEVQAKHAGLLGKTTTSTSLLLRNFSNNCLCLGWRWRRGLGPIVDRPSGYDLTVGVSKGKLIAVKKTRTTYEIRSIQKIADSVSSPDVSHASTTSTASTTTAADIGSTYLIADPSSFSVAVQ